MSQTITTVDDFTLLRAIALEEGQVHTAEGVASSIRVMVVESPGFQVVRTNEHLRGLLKTFLQANIAVDSKNKEITAASARNIIGRLVGSGAARLKSLQDELVVLEAIRDDAFKPYEMLRKLTDIDNVLLQRKPA